MRADVHEERLVAPSGTGPARQLANEAVRRELVIPQISQAVDGLTVLRNLAAHGPADELDSRKALDYLVLADGVLYAVEAKAASPPVSGQ